jgi:hypothetical protein
MMKTEFVLRFTVASDATLGDANAADILRKAAEYVAWSGVEDNRAYNVRDLNGNVVGRMGRYTTEDDEA